MSLEQKVEALTAAVSRLADVFENTAQQVAGKPDEAPQPAKAAPATEKTTAPAVKKAAPAPKAPEAVKAEVAGPVVDFEQVREVTRELGLKKDRADVVGLLGEFGVAKASELPKEKYAAYIEKAKALLGATAPAVEDADLADLAE